MRKLKPVSPGEMLREEFLKPLALSNYRLAKDIGVPAQRIGEILAGRRAVTADTDLRLSRYFGLSDGWWLALQARYDIELVRPKMGRELAKILPRAVGVLYVGRHTSVRKSRLWRQTSLSSLKPSTSHRRAMMCRWPSSRRDQDRSRFADGLKNAFRFDSTGEEKS